MANIELRSLKYFVVVAEELNFGRAANRLQIAQPPLSRQIQRLERELGVELFERLNRRIQLTPAGHVLLQEARQLLLQVEQVISLTQKAGRGEVGQLVVGFEGSFSYDIVPFSFKAFQAQYPDVTLVVHEMTTGNQQQALLENQIDIGFVVPPIDNTQLSVETVLREKFVLAVPEAHPLATQSEVRIHNLVNEPFVMGPHEKQCGLYLQVLRICEEAGFSPIIVQETNEIQMLLGFVAAGLGISLLPASVRSFQRSGIAYCDLHPPVPEIELAIAWKTEHPSLVLQRFLAVVRDFSTQNFT
jgi:DNA-binding transcriptional LysR family regulator